MGLLTGFAFVLFFALASVPIARAADRVLTAQYHCRRVDVLERYDDVVGYARAFCSSPQRESVWASVKRQRRLPRTR